MKPLLILLGFVLIANFSFSQQVLYSGNSSIENWFGCDSTKVKITTNTEQQIEASFTKGYWACFGVSFPSISIKENNQLEVILKGESETPIKSTQVMFRFKDENGNQTDDGTLPTNEILLIDNNFHSFYTSFKDHLHSSQGLFNAKKVNTLLIFIHFDSYLVEEFTGKITVQEIRLF